jgi:dTDP-4-amino-4,6-dideoxygalactose transaminase
LTDTGRTAAFRYRELLAGCTGLGLPIERLYAKHIFHQYTLRVAGNRRDRLRENLAAEGISSVVYYPMPIHKLPVYSDMKFNLPVAEKAAEEVLSIPIGPMLNSATQERIAKVIRKSL